MKDSRNINLNIFILSAVVLCFEIVSTRISSVVFVQNYAFIILSLSILGLSFGGVFSYYKYNFAENDANKFVDTIFYSQLYTSSSLVFFIVATIIFNITNPIIYFIFLFVPFFFAGVAYSQIFRFYAAQGFKLYAFDLLGAAIGSLITIIIFDVFNAPNAVLFLSLVLSCAAMKLIYDREKSKALTVGLLLIFLAVILTINGKNDFIGSVPVGNYPEKDIYYVYEGMDVKSKTIESRWSVNGRSDLVEYDFQDMVKQLFIDGAAGSQMFRFNGNISNHDKLLNKLLLEFTTAIPLLFLQENAKNNMLVIGPGGGKEILTGLLGEIKNITGVEVNQDFVDIVKKYKNYNGGIYSDFPNVKIEIAEGRNFVKRTKQKYDLMVMALPSTEQLQSIDNLASNENYLLTVEAIKDYLKVLSQNGELIFTVHNRWELIRLLSTSLVSLHENGISYKDALNHLIILGSDYAPTLVIKKNRYTKEEIEQIKQTLYSLPKNLPQVTYLPYNSKLIDDSIENILLKAVERDEGSLNEYVSRNSSDISAVRDDSPFFYKATRGLPNDYKKLLIIILLITSVVIFFPFIKLQSNRKNKNEKKTIVFTLIVFGLIGLGFMILEISLFQKLILYIGSPTITLSILLASILTGMGFGSFWGGRIFVNNPLKRLVVTSILITAGGFVLFAALQQVLNELMIYSSMVTSIICFFALLPFGFLLGIPFPTALQILKQSEMNKYIPWMYSVNGITSVLGSVLASVLSMTYGFIITFRIGLFVYALLFFCSLYFSYGFKTNYGFTNN